MQDVALHVGVEGFVAVLAGGFGLVEGDVCVAEQVAGGGAIADGDADAGVDGERHRRSRRE